MGIDGVSSAFTTAGSGNVNRSGAKDNSGNYLSMDDFFELLVAQLSNQDMYNTTDNTQFISQMAQFSMIQALTDLGQQSNTAYSVSLIGKGATVIETDANGTEQIISGLIQGVTLQNGNTQVVINGIPYSLSNVKEVYDVSLLSDTEEEVEANEQSDQQTEL